ncbi:DUF4145 domain-containing protein [Arthrobacter koreensis]|uniref:DUF4145 domain-containing protein n=1 Tax=Arthrobacter koreensis TaxID=199136 RepID=UPI0036DA04D6
MLEPSLSYGYREFHVVESAFTCDECDRLSVGVMAVENTEVHEIASPAAFWQSHDPFEWRPQYVEGQDFPDVPEHIAAAASEAHRGESVGNHMSAILMARTVIEATAKDKEIDQGGLKRKIELMVERGFIRPHIKEVADEVRHFGNDMAHGDITIPVDRDDALEVLGLMDEILNEVYQGPARLVAIQARRIERAATD